MHVIQVEHHVDAVADWGVHPAPPIPTYFVVSLPTASIAWYRVSGPGVIDLFISNCGGDYVSAVQLCAENVVPPFTIKVRATLAYTGGVRVEVMRSGCCAAVP